MKYSAQRVRNNKVLITTELILIFAYYFTETSFVSILGKNNTTLFYSIFNITLSYFFFFFYKSSNRCKNNQYPRFIRNLKEFNLKKKKIIPNEICYIFYSLNIRIHRNVYVYMEIMPLRGSQQIHG